MPKFQAIVVPYGLIVHLYGPVEGQRHDSSILRMSGLMEQLEQMPLDAANPRLKRGRHKEIPSLWEYMRSP